jgi:hypothetical protein
MAITSELQLLQRNSNMQNLRYKIITWKKRILIMLHYGESGSKR